MTTDLETKPATDTPPAPRKPAGIRVFGVGNAGINVLEQLSGSGLAGAGFVAVNTDVA